MLHQKAGFLSHLRVSLCVYCVIPNGEWQHDIVRTPLQDANLTACKFCCGRNLRFQNNTRQLTRQTPAAFIFSNSVAYQVAVATSSKWQNKTTRYFIFPLVRRGWIYSEFRLKVLTLMTLTGECTTPKLKLSTRGGRYYLQLGDKSLCLVIFEIHPVSLFIVCTFPQQLKDSVSRNWQKISEYETKNGGMRLKLQQEHL